MSLDLYLIDKYDGYVYKGNITHNLVMMASEAGLYQCLWRPEEHYSFAEEVVPSLAEGIKTLSLDPEKFKAMNPSNGWGTYEGLLEFACKFLVACVAHPDATFEVSR